MKRFRCAKGAPIREALALILALAVLSGASVWEGAAALAPRGELPEDGYYAATNSFPQNTVVDITNLETGKSVRAVVSSGLNTPGLLAILSADTAGRIGLSAKTIGRIRMTQPEDPIAFSRFTEGLVVSGDPDYDPEAMIAGDAREKAEAERGAASGVNPRIAPPPREEEAPAYGYEIPRGIEYSDYADYSHGSIVDVRGNTAPAPREENPAADSWEDAWDDQAYPGYPLDNGESVERTNYPVWEQGGSVGTVVSPRPSPPASAAPSNPSPSPVPAESRVPAEPAAPIDPREDPRDDPWEEAWRTTGQASGEIPGQGRFLAEAAAKAGENESRASARLLVSPPPPPPPSAEYALIPAEERPPAAQDRPAVRQSPPAESPSPAERLDESLFIEPIEMQREARAAEAARIAEAQRAAEAARAEEAQRAAEAARIAEAQRAAEAARIAEAQRAAEAARIPESEVLVLLDGEPQGPWVESIPEPSPPLPPPPEVLVKTPEENGEPQGPWVEPIPEPSPPLSPPPEVLVKLPEEDAGAPGGHPPSRETALQAGTAPEGPGPFSVSVNMIDELEKGKYYVQLGAYHNAASVESALLRIDSGYPLNVQRAGTADKPLYRLLVGPLNLGESGALVQRFKGSGYRDAYIRSN
jgi:hypothetical protein